MTIFAANEVRYMSLAEQIKASAKEALAALYPDAEIPASTITVNQTKPEFEGDYTLVLFPFLKILRQKPDAIGTAIGDYMVANTNYVAKYDIVAGFLNLTVKESYWAEFLTTQYNNSTFGEHAATGKKVMVEYSSPNTNKPLHFGHMRNIFLGYAMSGILQRTGNNVVKANLINDRGIHICKSMVAWKRYANGAIPESTGIKGDHIVGEYYVKFNTELKKEIQPHLDYVLHNYALPEFIEEKNNENAEEALSNLKKAKEELTKQITKLDYKSLEQLSPFVNELCIQAEKHLIPWSKVLKEFEEQEPEKSKKVSELKEILSPILSHESKCKNSIDKIKDILISHASLTIEAQEMLRLWEDNDPETVELWKKMNGWVYDGFDVTYKKMGVDFDKWYYESNTYLLGKDIVKKGLDKGILFTKENGSVWINLEDEGLDEKLLLRADGTSVYITQDIGTAILKYNDYGLDKSIYVIGDEQNYHMQVLQLILKKLGEPCADGIYHLSYGMVELPTGRMKSREGTVVDADDMIAEMIDMARQQTEEAGKTEGFTEEQLNELYETIGLGALKFYLLRVDPKRKMIFDPKESIDLHGFTATFIQYAHARICSILRKEEVSINPDKGLFANFKLSEGISPAEKALILSLEQYPDVMQNAADDYNPSLICNYIFQLAQQFNSFYDAHSISKAESEEKKQLRLMIIIMTASVMRHAMGTLGIRLPEKM